MADYHIHIELDIVPDDYCCMQTAKDRALNWREEKVKNNSPGPTPAPVRIVREAPLAPTPAPQSGTDAKRVVDRPSLALHHQHSNHMVLRYFLSFEPRERSLNEIRDGIYEFYTKLGIEPPVATTVSSSCALLAVGNEYLHRTRRAFYILSDMTWRKRLIHEYGLSAAEVWTPPADDTASATPANVEDWGNTEDDAGFQKLFEPKPANPKTKSLSDYTTDRIMATLSIVKGVHLDTILEEFEEDQHILVKDILSNLRNQGKVCATKNQWYIRTEKADAKVFNSMREIEA